MKTVNAKTFMGARYYSYYRSIMVAIPVGYGRRNFLCKSAARRELVAARATANQ